MLFINFFLILFAESFRGLLSAKALCREQLGPLSAQISFFLPGLDQWFAESWLSAKRFAESCSRERFNFFLEISFFVQFAESYSRQIIIFIFFKYFFVQLAS